MTDEPRYSVMKDVELGEECDVHDHVNLYGCSIGNHSKIDSFVYIEEDVRIGDECTIRPFVFIPTGVEIRDRVFIGPGVTFTNDNYPSVSDEWQLEKTVVCNGVGIGAGAVICPGVELGRNSVVGAGAVVTDDVDENVVVAGNPAKPIDTG